MDVDIVIPWVDGADTAWLECFELYKDSANGDKRVNRFRDWGILKYQFRSFEFCLPWVRKIHFVTWGHVPFWLNKSHSKLHIVRHEDFIPSDHLPIFNSRSIDVNMHRIPGLSDHFIYFNDDMFVIEPSGLNVFFKNNLPLDTFAYNVISDTKIAHAKINIVQLNFRRRKISLTC